MRKGEGMDWSHPSSISISSVSPGSCGSGVAHPGLVAVAGLPLTGYTGLCWSLLRCFTSAGTEFLWEQISSSFPQGKH